MRMDWNYCVYLIIAYALTAAKIVVGLVVLVIVVGKIFYGDFYLWRDGDGGW